MEDSFHLSVSQISFIFTLNKQTNKQKKTKLKCLKQAGIQYLTKMNPRSKFRV